MTKTNDNERQYRDSLQFPASEDWQKDDIEIAIASYADIMSQELLDVISGGRADFLRDHKRFREDITKAVEILEKMLYISKKELDFLS